MLKSLVQLFLADAGDGSQHRGQTLDFGQGLVHIAFARVVRENDQVRLGRAFAAHFVGLALQYRIDADAGTRQQAGDLGQHPASSATRMRR